MKHDRRTLELARAPGATLDDVLALAASLHPVHFEAVRLGEMVLHVLQITDMPAYLERLAAKARPGHVVRLPFWAKLWPSAFPLALLASRLDPGRVPALLEIGAGVGLCGLAAAKAGLETMITDVEPEALLFIRAAILKNDLEDRARVARVDFSADSLGRRFPAIVASEALYLENLHPALLTFLNAHAAFDGEVYLGCDASRRADAFFPLAAPHFRIQRTQLPSVDSQGRTHATVLYRMRATDHA